MAVSVTVILRELVPDETENILLCSGLCLRSESDECSGDDCEGDESSLHDIVEVSVVAGRKTRLPFNSFNLMEKNPQAFQLWFPIKHTNKAILTALEICMERSANAVLSQATPSILCALLRRAPRD